MISKSLQPIVPLNSGEQARLSPIPSIQAVLFDVYGTLLVSTSGDIGTSTLPEKNPGLEELFGSIGISLENPSLLPETLEILEKFIRKKHNTIRREGTEYPEIDIRHVWHRLMKKLKEDGFLRKIPTPKLIEILALQHEITVNPVWPMPGFPEIIGRLKNANLRLGLVSNAQFYTRLILETLSDSSLEELGFEKEFCAWSYEIAQAKPSLALFADPLACLAKEGIKAENVLFVGNDMLNDISTAGTMGCKTALFAGDSRSLRLRQGDARVSLAPDCVITDLYQLESILY